MEKTLLEKVADAVQEIEREGGLAERTVEARPDVFILVQVGSDCEAPSWSDDEDPKELFDPEELKELTPYQLANNGAADLDFMVVDTDGEQLDYDSGCYSGYLSQCGNDLPRETALSAARDILETCGLSEK